MKQHTSMSCGEEAFNRWHARHTHDDGTPKTRDKAIVAAINTALESLLVGSNSTVRAADIQSWTLQHLGFGESVLSKKRVDEHCLYLAGENRTSTKKFDQPLKNPKLRIVSDGVYALAEGAESFVYREISHRRKSKE